jgi:hypothetical protein
VRKERRGVARPHGIRTARAKAALSPRIEFGLTGQIGRLAGRGTKGLSVRQHGPHLDKVKFPDAALVRLKIFMRDLNKLVTLAQFVPSAKMPAIEPDTPVIRAVFDEIARVAEHIGSEELSFASPMGLEPVLSP